MIAKLPRQLKAFNVYVDGGSYAGRADAITLPPLSFLTEDHRAGGMDAPVALEMGMEAMQVSIVFSDTDPALLALLGRPEIPLVARGSVQAQGSKTEPVVVNMRGMFTNSEASEWRTGSKSTLTLTSPLSYFRYRQADVEYVEIDIINMVRRFGGEDQLAQHRAAIGL